MDKDKSIKLFEQKTSEHIGMKSKKSGFSQLLILLKF